MKHNKQPKTLGPEAGSLVTELHERAKTIFSYADVVDITGLNLKSARSLVGRMVQGGVTARLKPGLFILVPFEMGRERVAFLPVPFFSLNLVFRPLSLYL